MEYIPRVSPVHKSLHLRKTIAGVESRLAILNGTFALTATFALESPFPLVVAIGAHYVLRYLTKSEPNLMLIYMRYRTLGDIYDPWARRNMSQHARPKGFGKGLLC